MVLWWKLSWQHQAVWTSQKKKKTSYFLHAFKENICEPGQHFDVHWAGLLLSLPFQLSCWALGCCVLPHLPGCSPCAAAPSCAVPQVDGMSAGPGEEEFVCVAVCAAAQTGIPELAPTFLWSLHSSKEMGEIPIGASVCAWQGALVHEGKPCAAELDRNTAAPLLGASKRRSYASVVVLPDAAGSVCFK